MLTANIQIYVLWRMKVCPNPTPQRVTTVNSLLDICQYFLCRIPTHARFCNLLSLLAFKGNVFWKEIS